MSKKPVLVVLASTYPRWAKDPEPSFVHDLSRRLTNNYVVHAICPYAKGAQFYEVLDGAMCTDLKTRQKNSKR